MRKKIVAGNWKMNLTLKEGLSLASEIKTDLGSSIEENTEVILCTPFIHLAGVSEILKDKFIATGAQNCSEKESGAYTGEISATMIKSTGADYVIIGHSERRSYYNEDNELLATKTREAINKELRVIFCCGEVLSERENNNHFSVVQDQIEKGLRLVNNSDLDKLVIAYEPVWAIGTGVTASSEQAQEMHAFIRELIGKLFGPEQADKQVILYGGSCKPGNAKELFAMPDVDGGLIGGASLNAGDFTAIIKSFS